LGRGNQINTKPEIFQAILTLRKDQKKILPTTFPDKDETLPQQLGDNQEV
jgi:hypothetical protein